MSTNSLLENRIRRIVKQQLNEGETIDLKLSPKLKEFLTFESNNMFPEQYTNYIAGNRHQLNLSLTTLTDTGKSYVCINYKDKLIKKFKTVPDAIELWNSIIEDGSIEI